MAFRDSGQYLFRMQALLRQYLNAEVDVIDAAALTITGVGEDSFTTPDLDDADIQVFRDDREAECAAVWIVPSGDRRRGEYQKLGKGSSQARRDDQRGFEINVRVKSDQGSWGDHGAWFRADRIMSGVEAVLMKHPTLNIDAGANLIQDDLASWVALGDVRRVPSERPSEALCVTLAMDVLVRAMEGVAA